MTRPGARIAAWAASLAVVLGLGSGPAGAVDPYELNVILPLTGGAAFLGKNEAGGLRVLEERVNKTGGIAGRPLKFVIADDQSNPQVAVQLTNALIAKNVPIFLGSTIVAMCNAQAPLVKANGPVMYCLSAGFHPEPKGWAFTSTQATADLITVGARYLRLRGLTKIAILTSVDSSGQDGERGIDAALGLPENQSTMSVVAREHFNLADLSVNAQISRVKAAGAQALFAWSTGAPFGTVLRSVQEVGLNVPVMTTGGNINTEQMIQYAPLIPEAGLFFAGVPAVALDIIPRGAFHNAVNDYMSLLKTAGIKADATQAYAWDPASIVVSALRKLGPTATAPQIREYLSDLHGYVGVLGEYDFRDGSQRGLTGKYGVIVRWDKAKEGWQSASQFGGVPR